MRRLLFLCCLLFLGVVGFAQITDSYAFLKDRSSYAQLMQLVRGKGDAEEAERLCETFRTQQATQEDQVASIRATLACSRLLIKDGQVLDVAKGKTMAEQTLEDIKSLPEDSFFRLTLAADANSLLFLADRSNLSYGIASKKALDEAYKRYPDEFYAIYLKANNLVFAPGLFGGDVSKGRAMLVQLYQETRDKLASWDLASLCGVIGIASYRMKDHQTASSYLLASSRMYPVDSEVSAYLAKVSDT